MGMVMDGMVVLESECANVKGIGGGFRGSCHLLRGGFRMEIMSVPEDGGNEDDSLRELESEFCRVGWVSDCFTFA